jgi:hypothetical protein
MGFCYPKEQFRYALIVSYSIALELLHLNKKCCQPTTEENKQHVIDYVTMGIQNSTTGSGRRILDEHIQCFYQTALHLVSVLTMDANNHTYNTQWMDSRNPSLHQANPIRMMEAKLYKMVHYYSNWRSKVPIFDEQQSSILGIPIDLNHLPPMDETILQIYRKLRRIPFRIEYDMVPKWRNEMKRNNKSADWIKYHQICQKMETCRLYFSPIHLVDDIIVPTAEDFLIQGPPNLTEYTIRTYFDLKGIQI